MSTNQDNYVRCHQGVQLVCSKTLPCIQHVLKTWHQQLQQTLSPCATPHTCPTRGKPKTSKGSCQACVDWGDAVERALYNAPNSPASLLQWANINPTILHHDHVEAAKAFVLRLPPGQAHRSFGDFDSASILMIMMRFENFHGGDKVNYNLIKKVSDIRNSLSHMKVDNNLSIEDQQADRYFTDLSDLVVCLQSLHPQHFTQVVMQEALHNLCDTRVSPVTQKIRDEVLVPFSAAMEQVVRETIQDALASQVPTSQDPGDSSVAAFDIDKCREELCMEYEHNKGKVSLFPFDTESRVDIEDIFVNLELLEETSKPDRIKRVQLESYTDLFSLTNKKKANQPVVKELKVLVKGGPGSGKTTLAEKIAYDWAQSCRTQSYEGLGKFQLLFVLYLRDIDKDMTLEDAIFDQLLPYDTQLSKQSLGEYLRLNADKIVIIFDGADEYSGDFVPNRLSYTIADVVSYKLLRKSHVVVTTRPNRVGEFGEYAKVELMGFDDEGIVTYIEKFFQVSDSFLDSDSDSEISDKVNDSDSNSEISDKEVKDSDEGSEISDEVNDSDSDSKISDGDEHDATEDQKRKKEVAKTLYDTIYESASLASMVHIPVILTMICLLWKEAQKLPTRMTELYREFTHYFTQRWLEKNTTETESEELEANILVQLGKIALKCLFEDRLFFTSDEFQEQDALEKACLIGIVTQERKRSKLRMVKHFTFLHKTFQEYCAASYWVSLISVSSDQFLSYLRRLNRQNVHDFEYLLVFSCGLSDKAADMILAHVASIRYEGVYDEVALISLDDSWWRLGIRLLYESQSHSSVRRLVPWLKSTSRTINIVIQDYFTQETFVLFDYFTTSLEETTKKLRLHVPLEPSASKTKSSFLLEVIVRYKYDDEGWQSRVYQTELQRTSDIVNCLLNLFGKPLHEVSLKFDIGQINSYKTISMSAVIISNISSKQFQLLHIDLPSIPRSTMFSSWYSDDYDPNIDIRALGESIGRLPGKFVLKISAVGTDDITSLLEGITSVSSPSPIVGFESSCCTSTANSIAKMLSKVDKLLLLRIEFMWREPESLLIWLGNGYNYVLEILTPPSSARFLRAINTSHTQSLRKINFSGVYIGEAAYHIHKFLPSLHELSLAFAEMEQDHCASLFSKLTKSHDLHTLRLTGNKVGGPMTKSCFADLQISYLGMFRWLPQALGLDKSNSRVHVYVYNNASVKLKHALKHLKALEHLELRHTGLKPWDIHHVAEGLIHLRGLRHLDLSQNEIMHACPYLAEHLRQLTNLQHLELQETCIYDDGAITLTRSFKHLKKLEYVDLSGNPISVIGIMCLCKSFKSSPCLALSKKWTWIKKT